MTDTAVRSSSAPSARRVPAWVTALRVGGWTLIAAGVVVLLYFVYALFFTSLETRAAQAELFERWEADIGELSGVPGGAEETEAPDEPDAAPEAESEPPPVEVIPEGAAVAVMEFHRPGADEHPVHDEPLFVVSGVGEQELMRGPGHYPQTADPGAPGNFAVAGHRTTYGAPFFHLDKLEAADEVHVTDRQGVRHVYRVVEQRVVAPNDGWVLDSDPLQSGVPMLTLTTCHPRFSSAERLIVFAELV